MKTWTRTLALALLAAALPAASVMLPMRIPFQGKLIDPATNNPRNGALSMQFKLYNVPTGGAALFTETQTVTVVNGVFNVQIGTITLLTEDLFSGASAYLGVTVSPDVTEMLPRQPLSMSPYAYTAGQLVQDGDIRVNPGFTYSTFTAAGNLTMRYGVVGTTATFATVTSTGINTFNVVTSSGIFMGDGYLKIAANADGIDATGTGIVATTGTFATVTSTGINNFSIVSSSGIGMNDGYLRIAAASDGIDARGTGIIASTGVFTSSVTAKQFFGIGVTTVAIKTADTSRTVLTLVDDTELAIPMGANESYVIYGLFKSSSASATPDIRYAWTVPAGGVFDIGMHSNNGTLTTFNGTAMRDSGISGGLVSIGASIIQVTIFTGSVVNGATAGFLRLQWGQNATNATATTLTAGSFIAATRIK
ncbi:MAG: hypothetical protein PHS14_04975 [Elusimicrobia bacterium]|nr:hypothetical protein [Elusimicrobiota bacterium]